MNRLTYKKNWYDEFGNKHSYDSEDNYCIEKLGKLEDLEEELGIDLITLFKALKEGIYYKTIHNNVYHICYCSLSLNFVFDEYELWVEEQTILNGLMIHLKDYKKTWALNRSDLEND